MERSESENISTGMGRDEGLSPGSNQNTFDLSGGPTASSAVQTGSTGGQTGSTGQSGFSSSQLSSEEGGVSGRVKSVASTVKQKASTIPAMLADGLEAGAQALRQNKPATVSGDGSTAVVANDTGISAVTDTLATGMQSSAEWLRDADLDKIKTGVETQVKEHPARSLLVALGAGYLIGKALRR